MSEEIAKQVIVMRKDLNMRKGKMIAQGSHASVGVVLGILHPDTNPIEWDRGKMTTEQGRAITSWLEGQFSKICVYVESEDQLMEIYKKAILANLPVKLITDSGKTEFHGNPTRTCLAIGPAWSKDIDAITGNLKLL